MLDNAEEETSGRMFRFALGVVALLPVIFALVTLNYDNNAAHPAWQSLIRWFSVPVLLAEIACIGAALSAGVKLQAQLASMAKPLKIALAIVIAIALGTMIHVANNPLPAQIRTLSWVIHVAFGFSMAGLSARALACFGIERVWHWMALGLAIYFATLIAFIALMPDPAGFNWLAFNFAVLNIRQLGFFSGIGFGLMLGLALTTQNSRVRLRATGLAVAMIWISFWTGTRSSLLGCALALGLGFVLFRSMRTPRALFLMVMSVALGFALGFVHPPIGPDFNVRRLFSSMQVEERQSDITSGRTEIWKGTVKAIAQRPFFGHGESQFSTNDRRVSLGFNHPHNAFLQFAYQWGLIGAAAFFALFFVALWRVVRVAQQWPVLGLPPFLAITTMFGMAMTEGSLYHPWPVMMMAFCAALAIGGASSKAERQTTA